MLTHSGSPIVPRHATSLLRIIVFNRPSTSVMHRIRGGVPNVIHGHTGGRLLSTILHRHWIQLLYRIPNRLKCVIPPLTTFFCFASLHSPNMAAFSFERKLTHSFERKLNQSPNMADLFMGMAEKIESEEQMWLALSPWSRLDLFQIHCESPAWLHFQSP